MHVTRYTSLANPKENDCNELSLLVRTKKKNKEKEQQIEEQQIEEQQIEEQQIEEQQIEEQHISLIPPRKTSIF
jgi:thiaminase